jgi:uncharacterized phage protein (TIGR01671 family)
MRQVQLMDWSDWWVSTGHTWERENGLEYGERNSFKNEQTDRHIIMQYTGLKDKNGKEIYESDKVEFNDFDSLRTGGYTEDNILQGDVSFSCGGWIVKTERGHYDLYTAIVNDEELEIIGNIYENPELLEGKQNE